jgi:adenine/guanine/hypoxanthine permease
VHRKGGAALSTRQQQIKDIVAGLAVFFSMSYVVFAIPLMLSKAGFPAAPVFFGTCAIAAVASWASGYFAKSPAAIAPGLALSAALAQFLSLPDTKIKWPCALIICAFSGCILLATSTLGGRRSIVDSIPPIIKLALVGGIGAVLATNALKFIDTKSHQTFVSDLTLFVIGLVFISLGYVVLRNLSVRAEKTGKSYARLLDICGRSFLFLSVPLIATLSHFLFAYKYDTVAGIGTWIWLDPTIDWKNFVTAQMIPEAVILCALILYLLYADVVGSPYQMALEDVNYKTELLTESQNEVIQRSFVVDSSLNIIAPLFGTSPPVYYAENLAGKVIGGAGPLVAYVSAAGFVLIFAIGAFLAVAGKPIQSVIPGIAVAPALFFVGLLIIAKSLARSTLRDITPTGIHTSQIPTGTNPETAEFLEMGRYMPAAVTIVATPIAGFEVGVACGILTYYLFFIVFPPEQKTLLVPAQGALHFFAVIAFLALMAKMYVAFS